MDPHYLPKMSLNKKIHTSTQNLTNSKNQKIPTHNPHPKPHKTFHNYMHLNYILLTLILTSFLHTPLKYSTNKRPLTPPLHNGKHKTHETPPTTKDTPTISHPPLVHHPKANFIFIQRASNVHTNSTLSHSYNNKLTTPIINTNFIGTFFHILHIHLKNPKSKTLHYYMWNTFTLILLANDNSPNLGPTYHILENLPKSF